MVVNMMPAAGARGTEVARLKGIAAVLETGNWSAEWMLTKELAPGCWISPGQHSAFRGSTGVPRQCFGAPDGLEQSYMGWRSTNPEGEERFCEAVEANDGSAT